MRLLVTLHRMITKNIVINCPDSEPPHRETRGGVTIDYIHGDLFSLLKNHNLILSADIVVLFEQSGMSLFCWPRTSDEVAKLLGYLGLISADKIVSSDQFEFTTSPLDRQPGGKEKDAATYAYKLAHPITPFGQIDRFMKKFISASVGKIIAPMFYAAEYARPRDVLIVADSGVSQSQSRKAKGRLAIMTELLYSWNFKLHVNKSDIPVWGRLRNLATGLALPQSRLFSKMPSSFCPFVKNIGKNAQYQMLLNDEHQPMGLEAQHWTTHVAILDMPENHSQDINKLVAKFIGLQSEQLFSQASPHILQLEQKGNKSPIVATQSAVPLSGADSLLPDIRNADILPTVMTHPKIVGIGLDVAEEDCVKAKIEVERLLNERGLTNPLLGDSHAMLCMYPDILDTFKHPHDHVLIYGETGSGKAMLYDLIRRISLEQGKPFLIPTLTGLEDTHLISTVFGHEKGAYTDATTSRKGAVDLASGGTLVLDNLQAENKKFFNQFLRVLEPSQSYQALGAGDIRKANCRIIAGFNRPVEELLDGELPADWPERFQIKILMPCLDERKEDIPALVKLFTKEFFEKCEWLSGAGVTEEWLDEQCVSKMSEWIGMSWRGAKGNVRGLRQEVETHLRNAVRFLNVELSEKKAPGNQNTIPLKELNRILREALDGRLSWLELQKRLIVPGTEEQAYSTLKSLQNRVRKNKAIIDIKAQEYVELLRDAVV